MIRYNNWHNYALTHSVKYLSRCFSLCFGLCEAWECRLYIGVLCVHKCLTKVNGSKERKQSDGKGVYCVLMSVCVEQLT